MKLVLVKGHNGRRKLTVQLPVTTKELRKGINAGKPGLYLFRGAWYGENLRDLESYGKIEGQVGIPIGKLTACSSAYLKRKLR